MVDMSRKRGPVVDHEEFLQAVQPYSAMLRTQANAAFGRRSHDPSGASTTPAANSEAMAELAVQAQLAGVWDDVPIDTALTHLCLLLTAAEDAMKALADLIVAERTPLYSHQVIMRSGLECLALAHWLGERGIGARERVRRSLNERISSAYQVSRLPRRVDSEPGRQQRLLQAERLGFPRTKSKKGQLTFFAPPPPTITSRIEQLLGHAELGSTVYSFASSIAHGGIWGLTERVEPPERRADDGPVVTAMLTTSVESLATPAVVLIASHRTVYNRFVGYMGWHDEEWAQASAEVWVGVGSYLQAVDKSGAAHTTTANAARG